MKEYEDEKKIIWHGEPISFERLEDLKKNIVIISMVQLLKILKIKVILNNSLF